MAYSSFQLSRLRSALATGIGRRVRSRIGLGLGLFGFLATLSFGGAIRGVGSHLADRAIVDAASRQEMLSQRVSMLVLRYAATDPVDAELGRQLDRAVAQMARTHRRLVGSGSPQQVALYRGPSDLEVRLADFLHRARAVRRLPARELDPNHPLVTAIVADARGPLLADLGRATAHHRGVSSARVDGTGRLQFGLLVLTFALAGGLVVFWPLVDQRVRHAHHLTACEPGRPPGRSGRRYRSPERPG